MKNAYSYFQISSNSSVFQVKKVGADMSPVFVYIKPPTFETLEQRLLDRQTENKDSLEKRLSQAKV